MNFIFAAGIGMNCIAVVALWIRVTSFQKRLVTASDAAHDHFEALRKVRQRGV